MHQLRELYENKLFGKILFMAVLKYALSENVQNDLPYTAEGCVNNFDTDLYINDLLSPTAAQSLHSWVLCLKNDRLFFF